MNSTEISRYAFRQLDPPAGGLERLQRRIARPQHHTAARPVFVLAGFALMAIVAGNLWASFEAARQERRGIAELQVIFISASLPTLTIDGKEPVQLDLGRDDVIAFWVKDEHQAPH
ncbi:MAG: hypothetical protein ACXIUM_03320 [Wenzhouxiangella sp.]